MKVASFYTVRVGVLLLLLLVGVSCSKMEQAWKTTKRTVDRAFQTTKKMLSSKECSTDKDCVKKDKDRCQPKTGKCVACVTSDHCQAKSKEFPVCDQVLGNCVQCQHNKDCKAISARLKICYGQRCVECLQRQDCQPWQKCKAPGTCEADPEALVQTATLVFALGILLPLGLMVFGPKIPNSLAKLGLIGLTAGPMIGLFAPYYMELAELTYINTLFAGTSLSLAVGIGCLAAIRWDKAGFALGLLLQSSAYHALLLHHQEIVGPKPVYLKLFVLSGLIVSIVLFSLSLGFANNKVDDGENPGRTGKTVLSILGILLTAAEMIGLVMQLMNYIG